MVECGLSMMWVAQVESRERVARYSLASDAVNTGLDQDKAELAVLVVSVALQVLSNRHRLFDKVVEVLGQRGRKALGLENTENLLPSNSLNLCNALLVPQQDANLGGLEASLGQLDHCAEGGGTWALARAGEMKRDDSKARMVG